MPIHAPEEVIELHVFTEDTANDITALADFCEKRGLQVVRVFWRGVETDDLEQVGEEE